MKTARN